MFDRGWRALVLVAGLLAACGASNAARVPTRALPTAHIAQAPAAGARVIPLTPTHAPATLVVATSIPAIVPVVLLPVVMMSADAPTPSSVATTNPASAITTTATTDPLALEAQLVDVMNQVRAANGLPPYQHNPELSAAARGHSCDLAAHGLISHTSTDGRTLADRLSSSNPPWEWPSESIAAGTDDPVAVVAMWMDEPPEGWHRRNILDTDQHDVGAGYCFAADDPSGNHHYWTADFSRRASD